MVMDLVQKDFAEFLAKSGVLFFDDNLRLKDGRSTPYFLNFGKLNSGSLNSKLGDFFGVMLCKNNLINKDSVLFGPSYKASVIASATVNSLWNKHRLDVRFEYDRKEAKTHGDASKKKKFFVMDALKNNSKVLLLDDVGTSMQTKYDMIEKLEEEKKRSGNNFSLDGVCLGVDREQVAPVYEIGDIYTAWQDSLVPDERGEDSISEFTKKTGVGVFSIAKISEIVSYLYANDIPVSVRGEMQPIPDDVFFGFVDYFLKYGIKRKVKKRELIKQKRSVILACDVSSLPKLIDLISEVDSHPVIGAYKLGFELVLNHGLKRVASEIRLRSKKPIIYDHQKAGTDVPFTAEKFARIVKYSGVDSAILFPRENDFRTQYAWISALQDVGMNVMLGAELTSRKPTKDIERIYWSSLMIGVTDFVVPGNKPERISFYKSMMEKLCSDFTFYSPGLVTQGGSLSESAKAAGSTWHAIVGRAIINAKNKKEVLDDFSKSLNLSGDYKL